MFDIEMTKSCFSVAPFLNLILRFLNKDEVYAYQAAFCVRFPEDLRRGFPNRSAYWRTIVVFGVKRRKTKPARRKRV